MLKDGLLDLELMCFMVLMPIELRELDQSHGIAMKHSRWSVGIAAKHQVSIIISHCLLHWAIISIEQWEKMPQL